MHTVYIHTGLMVVLCYFLGMKNLYPSPNFFVIKNKLYMKGLMPCSCPVEITIYTCVLMCSRKLSSFIPTNFIPSPLQNRQVKIFNPSTFLKIKYSVNLLGREGTNSRVTRNFINTRVVIAGGRLGCPLSGPFGHSRFGG